ncbi:lipoprotein localization protein LolB [Billgrantia tianxiuensis]|jgi:outer membrane lipoprotein LolB|uniref:Outer-membrane lipoprotein LolB n=1 Tax=Billgrantia tianxiuensis TaxID=2497861 RepID=A0A6I6SSS1_9GAMM|nr:MULTISPECIES: lipoprotein insertase outer membrane protein LolB [Halomonas]MCE8035748.1 lipoprotein localization protein LolB [Halomonas sp. MCCC 1A11057]QHC50675.1 lipoprotein localization protein LolB [Halomonas tianxiuensis]
MRRPTLAIRWFAMSLALALLAGCATPGTTPDGGRSADQWQAQQERLEALDTWILIGKAGLRTSRETTSANLDWSQHPHYYRMLISGPFGSGRNLLEGREGRFTLTNAEGRFEAPSPESLMQQQLGWSLPVSSLSDWIRGLPADHSDYRLERDERGFPQQLEQDGWQIVYRDWAQVESLWLPRRLSMEYDDLSVTLVVTEWRPVIDD